MGSDLLLFKWETESQSRRRGCPRPPGNVVNSVNTGVFIRSVMIQERILLSTHYVLDTLLALLTLPTVL